MKASRAHRRHAIRVAAIATLVVLACYVVAALVLNALVTNHLAATTDARLADHLHDAGRQTLTLPNDGPSAPTDVDDAPIFVWSIAPSGDVTALTNGAPSLPVRRWGGGPQTLALGSSTLRFSSVRANGDILVAGTSIANTAKVQSALLVAEVVFGAILAIAVFAGATVVGLRASAPSELVRRRQAEFTADASHELRTPISVIEAEVGLALDRPREPAAYQEVLGRVWQESQRLRGIVEDLLWLARADNEPVPSDPDDVTDVAATTEACVQRFAAVAATRGMRLTVRRVGADSFTVQAPPDWIDRLAGVLIDNACKFAGDAGQIDVSVRTSGGRVHLRVDDSGPGIPPGERDAVFDRFHRATNSVAGTGLGLAIADSVVRGTHGTWDIGAADLGGARMEVWWRRAAPRRGKITPAAEETLSGSLT